MCVTVTFYPHALTRANAGTLGVLTFQRRDTLTDDTLTFFLGSLKHIDVFFFAHLRGSVTIKRQESDRPRRRQGRVCDNLTLIGQGIFCTAVRTSLRIDQVFYSNIRPLYV